jgi:hypothetical protein
MNQHLFIADVKGDRQLIQCRFIYILKATFSCFVLFAALFTFWQKYVIQRRALFRDLEAHPNIERDDDSTIDWTDDSTLHSHAEDSICFDVSDTHSRGESRSTVNNFGQAGDSWNLVLNILPDHETERFGSAPSLPAWLTRVTDLFYQKACRRYNVVAYVVDQNFQLSACGILADFPMAYQELHHNLDDSGAQQRTVRVRVVVFRLGSFINGSEARNHLWRHKGLVESHVAGLVTFAPCI